MDYGSLKPLNGSSGYWQDGQELMNKLAIPQ